nr:PREDICTED: uncharacterized protein LOC105662017 [Megachile rotundata]
MDNGEVQFSVVGEAPEAITRRNNMCEESVCREVTINLPLENIKYCPVCELVHKSIGFLNLKDLKTHLNEQHGEVKTKWQCRSCKKCFPGAHNCVCYIPKCKGVQETMEKNFICEECSESFATKRGLSIHELHRHPQTRNDKRAEECAPRTRARGRKNYLWTNEEINKLIELNERFKNERYPNVKIQEFFPSKTIKQKSNKRKDLRTAERQTVRGNQNINISTASIENYSPRYTGPLEEVLMETNEPEATQNEYEEQEETWHNVMLREAQNVTLPENNDFHECIKELDLALQDIITNQNLELNKKIDKWINDTLNPKLLNIGSKEHCNGNSNEPDSRAKRNGSKKNKRNHNARARYGFARCQELFTKCPRKLAEIAISGDFSAVEMHKELPTATEIRQLYNELWGKNGPASRNNEAWEAPVPDIEACPPFTVQEIEKRINKIKNGTAGGLDQITKVHLKKNGAAEVVTKLFNILMLLNHYPEPWKEQWTLG